MQDNLQPGRKGKVRSLLLGADKAPDVINKCLRRGDAVPIYLRHSSGTAQLMNTGF